MVAERLESLSLASSRVHDDLSARNALEERRSTHSHRVWTAMGSRPALVAYAAVLYVLMAALGIDPGPLIRAMLTGGATP